MRKILVLAAITLGILALNAQSGQFFSTEKADKGVTFGVRGGLNLASFSTELIGESRDDFKQENLTGYNAGVSIDIPIVKSLYVQTGAFWSVKGTKASIKNSAYHLNFNPSYVEVPLLASYRYNVTENVELQANLGGFAAYGITGNLKKNDIGNEKFKLFSDIDYFEVFKCKKLLKPFDAGLCFGVGATFSDHFYCGVTIEKGLVNIANRSAELIGPDGKDYSRDYFFESNWDYAGYYEYKDGSSDWYQFDPLDIKTFTLSFNVGYYF